MNHATVSGKPACQAAARLLVWALCFPGSMARINAEEPKPEIAGTVRAPGDLDAEIPAQPVDPQDVGVPLRLQVSRINPPDLVIDAPPGTSGFLKDDNLFVVRAKLSRVEVIAPGSGEVVRQVALGERLYSRLWMSRDRTRLLAHSAPRVKPELPTPLNSALEVLDLEDWQVVSKIAFSSREGLTEHAISADGATIAMAIKAGVVVTDVESGKQVGLLPLPVNRVDALAFSPDGDWLVVSNRNNLTFWKWKTEDEPRQVHVGRRIISLEFTPDSRFLIEGPDSRAEIEVRSLISLEVVNRLATESGTRMTARNLEVIDGGRALVAGNAIQFDPRKLIVNQRIHFWDLTSGRMTRKLHLARHQVEAIAVSPSGRYLSASLRDRAESLLAIWDLTRPNAGDKDRTDEQ